MSRVAVSRGSLVLVLACVLAAGVAFAQEQTAPAYRLGAGDEVQLGVLQRPDLDRELVVRPDGTVIVPLVGPIAVAGLTAGEAEHLIRERLRLFNRDIGEVSLTVTQYNALRVHVLGEVAQPGHYAFQAPPTVWEAIRAAGGATADANLTAVRLVREENGAATILTIDVSPLLTGPGPVPSQDLRAGDTLLVPSRDAVAASPAASGVQVLGSVLHPGTYPLAEPTRLIGVLLMAGGTVETSALDRVWWVHADDGGRGRASRIDLGHYLHDGSPAGNPLVHPGDTVQVDWQGEGFFRTMWPALLSTVTAATAILIATNR